MKLLRVIPLASLIAFSLAVPNCRAQDLLFRSSVAAMGSSLVFDWKTSTNMNGLARQGLVHETNSLLSDGRGGFDPVKGALYKGAIGGGLFALEKLLLHYFRAPEERRAFKTTFALVNFTVTAVQINAGVHNIRLGQQYGLAWRPGRW